ncbi:MAG: hypothetical protein ACREDO_03260, partial [Methyloceanibacter sp.]
AAASKSPATNEEPAAAPAEPAQAEPAPAESAPAQSAPAEVPEERTWTGVVQEPLGEPSWRQTAAS